MGKKHNLDPLLIRNLSNGLAQYDYSIRQAIVNSFQSTKYLTTSNQTSVNKIYVLNLAQHFNLKTPAFILTNEKRELLSFFSQFKKVIIKDLDNYFFYKNDSKSYMCFGELVTLSDIKELPSKFHLTFFQQYIEKEYEVRSFYLDNKFYSMAIFSQRDSLTKIDFRRYNYANPTRTVPYKLPNHIEKKLLKLMRELKLKTGSIDILKCYNGNYYFLEVNPVGQFGMVSEPCNYNLEYKIAKYLTT